MPTLETSFLGVQSPNPFWVASSPLADKKINVTRAFEAGWGGVVWKTIGEKVTNTSSRYASMDQHSEKAIGFSNIELISDRPLEDNLREASQIIQEWPDRAVVLSLMAATKRESWKELVKKAEDTGCHALELNFGCPHGMNERGMGSVVGQDPEIASMITEWVVEASSLPVVVKLTPNVHSVVPVGRAVVQKGCSGLSLINTIQSVMGVDLDTFIPYPRVGEQSAFGGYSGPGVKPIALKMIASIRQDPVTSRVPASGMGGISNWRDAAEFLLLGASNVQVCTAVMKYGFRIIEDMCEGLLNWMEEKGFASVQDFQGKSVDKITDWENLDLNYHVIASIDQEKCINCGICYIVCEDASHQSIRMIRDESSSSPNRYEIIEEKCIGCNLCQIVCPVEGCITMYENRRGPPLTWKDLQRK